MRQSQACWAGATGGMGGAPSLTVGLLTGEGGDGAVDALGGGEEGVLVVGTVLDHGDDVYEGLFVVLFVGLLEGVDVEALAGFIQAGAEFGEGLGGPVFAARKEDFDGGDVGQGWL